MEGSNELILSSFNRAHRKMDGLYHDYARRVGLSDTAMWLLYSLCEQEYPCTQRDLCETWFYAPQTINTALKSLAEKGFVSLELAPRSRKNKQIYLTEAGKALVEEKIIPLIQAEERSFERLGAEERTQLLAITQRHIALLTEEIDNIIGDESSEDGSSQ